MRHLQLVAIMIFSVIGMVVLYDPKTEPIAYFTHYLVCMLAWMTDCILHAIEEK